MGKTTALPMADPPVDELFYPTKHWPVTVIKFGAIAFVLLAFAIAPMAKFYGVVAGWGTVVATAFVVVLMVVSLVLSGNSGAVERSIEAFYRNRGAILSPEQKAALHFPGYRPTEEKLYCGVGLATVGGELTIVHLLWEDGRMKLFKNEDRKEILPVS